MRLWIASLLVAAGCNQIFGTGDVHLHVDDGGLLADASPYAMQITGMAYDSGKVADPTTILPTFPVLSALTSVQVGAMAPASASAFPELAQIPVDDTGTFLIPFELALQSYRIVYIPTDAVPVEYQTTLHVAGHFIANIDLGRPARVPVPAGATMNIDILNATNYTSARLVETGAWATHYIGAVTNPFMVHWSTVDPSQGSPVNSFGPLSSPESLKGDRMLVVDAEDSAQPGIANSYSLISMDSFNGSVPNNLVATPWTTVATATPPMTPASYQAQPGFVPAVARVTDATRANMVSDDDNPISGSNAAFVWSGVTPSAALPNFIASGAGGKASPVAQSIGSGGVSLPTFAFMSTRVSDTSLPYVDVFNGTIAPKFPKAIFARVSRSRTTVGVKITEGIQTVSLTTGASAVAKLDLAVGQAYQAGAHMMLNNTDIWLADSISWNVPRAPLMTFTFGVDGVVDDCVSTLYSVTGGAYAPVRRYLMPATANQGAPSGIVVDNKLLMKNQNYVFGVACHQGYPNAVNGDWSVVSYPFSESVVYSFPFVVTSDPI